MPNENSAKFVNLRRLNLIAMILHFCQGVAVLLLTTKFSLPVITSFLKFDFATQKLVPNPKDLFTVQIGPLVAAFFFLSALAHLIVSLPKFNDWYNKNLGRHINIARWVEYSFSSTLMIIIIAMLVGIYDASALIAIAVLNASMILFGWLMELHNGSTDSAGSPQAALTTGQKVNWLPFIFGCIAGIGPWLAIGLYLWAPGAEAHAPDFVYWIYFSIFLFFNCFAFNQYLQYKKVGRWADYLYGERAYIILSLVAKSLLAWQVFGGTLRP